jgi:hypothetical protein
MPELVVTPLTEAEDGLVDKFERSLNEPGFLEAETEKPYRCEYTAAESRINLVTLILSLIASLASIVLYFLLMDIKEDVVKLKEIVEIMKDDIQMGREEPPAE